MRQLRAKWKAENDSMARKKKKQEERKQDKNAHPRFVEYTSRSPKVDQIAPGHQVETPSGTVGREGRDVVVISDDEEEQGGEAGMVKEDTGEEEDEEHGLNQAREKSLVRFMAEHKGSVS